ncbi:MAG: PHD finger domain-containing protein [Candidatus Thiodiazotropha sp.]
MTLTEMATTYQLVPAKTKMLTRKSSTSNMLSSTSDSVMSTSCTKDYALDKNKSLAKKNDSCAKEHMKCEMKQGNNLVIELRTAAYELSKTCIHELFNNDSFPFAVEKRDGLDLNGANVDICYRVFNKKSDGSSGRMLKYVVNLYHTTSQILVNTCRSKIDLFTSVVLENLIKEMRARCNELNVINKNIATALSSDTSLNKMPQIENTVTEEVKTDSTLIIEIENDCNSDDEVCEICPICQQQAYGRVVGCGECGDWFHFECINIDNTAIEALGSDDFVCVMCTDNLKYSTIEPVHNENEQSTIEKNLNTNPNVQTSSETLGTSVNSTKLTAV